MKPIKLEMAAFGPYQNVVSIDFTELNRYGLFLITGPTGGGKTTIFDAITFALYGEASGSSRESKSLRCDFASPKQETYVCLDFSFKNKHYRIKRSPQYTKPGRKTAISAQAELFMPDGKIYSSLRDVNRVIVELLGVDAHQFKQIAMIAQGEFTKLIYASSDEKEKIFRKLFGTKKYEDFEDLLKQRYQQLKKKIDTTLIQIETLKKQMDYHDKPTKEYIEHVKEDLNKQKSELDLQAKAMEDMRLALEKKNQEKHDQEKNNQNLERLKAIQDRLAHLDERQEEMKALEKTYQRLNIVKELSLQEKQMHSSKKEWETLKQEKEVLYQKIVQLQEEIKPWQEAFDTIPTKQETIQQNKIEREQLQKELLALKEKEHLQKEKMRYKKNLEEETKRELRLVHDTEMIHQTLEKLNLDLNQRSKIQMDQLEKTQQLNQIVQKSLNIKMLKQDVEKIKIKQQDLDKEMLVYTKEYEQYQALTNEVLVMENQFFLSQAGILASTLKENEPCPVCGSLHHPQPAKMIGKVTSKEEIDEKKQVLNRQQVSYQKQMQKVAGIKQEISVLEEHMDMLFKQFSIPKDELDLYDENCQVQKNQLENQLHKINTDLELLSKKEKEYQFQQEVYETKQKENEKIQSTIQELKQKMYLIEGRLDNYKQTSKDANGLNQKIEALESHIQRLQLEIEKTTSQYTLLQTRLNHDQGHLNSYDQEIKKWEKMFLNDQEVFMTSLKQYHIPFEEYQNDLQSLNQMQTMQEKLEWYKREVEKNQTMLHTLKQDILSMTPFDLDIIHQEILLLTEKLNKERKSYQDRYAHYQQNNHLLQQIQESFHSIEKIEPEYQMYYELFSVTSGNNALKLSFERYILAAYFEQILQLANIRFKEMTNQRYALLRKEEKGSRQSGLDIVVQDFESGTIRDIKTLSGGETFKAALSLALGLSDMIQGYAGGIELNTLFIDEGFGSLDSDSLAQAIHVLLHLKRQNKMIGIISHVQELKEQIDRQIIIKKDPIGSHIEIK